MVILIADDDRLVRFTIKSILGEILEDSGNIFLEAANGRDMIRLCREGKPDVAFVDIRMPYVDGLNAIAECRKYSEWTEYVIVSGYSDFTYAQTGIRLGITEYLLKPVDEEQLRPVVEKLKKKLEKQKNDSNARFQLQVMEVFNYYSTVGLEEYEEEQEEKSYRYLVFLLYVKAGIREREKSLDFQRDMVKSIRQAGEKAVLQKGHYGITNTAEGTICAVFGVSDIQREFVLSRIRKISALAGSGSCPCYYFRWFCRDTLKEVYSVCETADAQEYLLMDQPVGEVLEYGKLEVQEYERTFLCQIQNLLDAWEQADGIACKEIINTIWRNCKETGKYPQVDLENLSRFCSSICRFPVDASSWKLFFTSFVEHSEEMYSGAAVEEKSIVEQVKGYIQKYYMNDISISLIGDHFGLTANYLSTLFHRKTGEKFIDYLTGIRMEAAKKLLVKNTSASVQDIALMVGYNSVRHFSSLFQKQTGETPSAYRKSRC